MLPPGHPRQFLAPIKSRKRPAKDMGPELGEIKQAEARSMKMAMYKIRHFMDLGNTQARAFKVMSSGSNNFTLASMRELLSRMK